MASSSKHKPIPSRELAFYRQRNRSRLADILVTFFSDEAEKSGITKKDIAELLQRDPAQITRWLTLPGNITPDTISDLLLSLDAEMEYRVVKFKDLPTPNYEHPLVATLDDGGSKRGRRKRPSPVGQDTVTQSNAPVKILEPT